MCVGRALNVLLLPVCGGLISMVYSSLSLVPACASIQQAGEHFTDQVSSECTVALLVETVSAIKHWQLPLL